MIKHYRSRYDIPFDELYHKEKAKVQAVIEAHQALKRKESELKNLFEMDSISHQEYDRIMRGSLLNQESVPLFEQS